jgi:hypothetical protein
MALIGKTKISDIDASVVLNGSNSIGLP